MREPTSQSRFAAGIMILGSASYRRPIAVSLARAIQVFEMPAVSSLLLLDSDDFWEAEKLERHVEHLRRSPHIGVSYAASTMIDDDGKFLRIVQRPKLRDIEPKDVFLRNPVGNGSAPVLRRAVFENIGYLNRDREEIDYFRRNLPPV